MGISEYHTENKKTKFYENLKPSPAAPGIRESTPELVVIALCGKARAGKDTVAQALGSHAGFFRIALADGLKSLLNDLDGHTWEFRKERDAAGKSDRWAAQQAGTECREAIDDRYHWVNHLGIKLHYANKVHPAPRHRFVVPDLRYPYEETRLRMIVESLGGRLEVWRIERPGQDDISESGHSSEKHVYEIPVNRVVVNSSTLADLYETVKSASIKDLVAGEPAPSLGGKAPSVECCSQLPCDSPETCPCWPDCDMDFDGRSPAPQGIAAGCSGCVTMDGFMICTGKNCTGGKNKMDCWPAPRKHHIPNVEDALNGRGPFPVLYLSGPMSGHRDLNFPAFNIAAEKLRRLGFPVLNPADFGQGAGMDWEDNLHRDLYILGCADVLVQLPGWENSRGASLEFNTAVALGKGVTGIHTLISDS